MDGYGYVNLEDSDSAEFARSDPKGFLKCYPAPLVIDEAQRVRELQPGDRLLSWTAQPANRVRFTLTNGQNGVLRADADGVTYMKCWGMFVAIR